jgi:hypothetical protein
MMGHPITVSVDVDIDLSDIDTEDLIEELNGRRDIGMGTDEVLTKIWIHDREGRKEEAYALMREYVLDRLGKVV